MSGHIILINFDKKINYFSRHFWIRMLSHLCGHIVIIYELSVVKVIDNFVNLLGIMLLCNNFSM